MGIKLPLANLLSLVEDAPLQLRQKKNLDKLLSYRQNKGFEPQLCITSSGAGEWSEAKKVAAVKTALDRAYLHVPFCGVSKRTQA